jgi:hypothetical protein
VAGQIGARQIAACRARSKINSFRCQGNGSDGVSYNRTSCLPDVQAKNENLGKFWEDLAMEDVGILYEHLVYIFTAFGTFCGHLVNSTVIRYILPHFGKLCKEKSGNPALA